jgi:hypothetical protein
MFMQKKLSRGQNHSFVLGKSRFQTYATRPAIWNGIFSGFLQTLRTIFVAAPKLSHNRFLPYPFLLINHPTVRRCTV